METERWANSPVLCRPFAACWLCGEGDKALCVLLFALPQVGGEGAKVAVEPFRIPLAHTPHLFDNRVCRHGQLPITWFPHKTSGGAVAHSPGCGASTAIDEWEILRMLKRFDAEIHVQGWPVQVVHVQEFDGENVVNRGASEPGVFLVWQEILGAH